MKRITASEAMKRLKRGRTVFFALPATKEVITYKARWCGGKLQFGVVGFINWWYADADSALSFMERIWYSK